MSRGTHTDIRYRPAYTVREAAHHLRIPAATLRAWVKGRGDAKPLISMDDPGGEYLSFANLVEAHVLSSIRSRHGVGIARIRKALDFVGGRLGGKRPLMSQDFLTDGLDLFVERCSRLANASRGGQTVMRELIEAHMRRVEWDRARLPVRLYPLTRDSLPDSPARVVMSPDVSFGRPVIVGTGIPTGAIFDRFRAGDASADLAEDFGLSLSDIEEAIRYETAA